MITFDGRLSELHVLLCSTRGEPQVGRMRVTHTPHYIFVRQLLLLQLALCLVVVYLVIRYIMMYGRYGKDNNIIIISVCLGSLCNNRTNNRLVDDRTNSAAFPLI